MEIRGRKKQNPSWENLESVNRLAVLHGVKATVITEKPKIQKKKKANWVCNPANRKRRENGAKNSQVLHRRPGGRESTGSKDGENKWRNERGNSRVCVSVREERKSSALVMIRTPKHTAIGSADGRHGGVLLSLTLPNTHSDKGRHLYAPSILLPFLKLLEPSIHTQRERCCRGGGGRGSGRDLNNLSSVHSLAPLLSSFISLSLSPPILSEH